MARAASVVLSPAQKKEAVVNAKVEASKAKATLTELTKARKTLVETQTKANKAAAKAADEASKKHLAALKEQDKLITAATKAAQAAQAKLEALVPPKAVPTPTAPV
jgi:hypothetical protein